MPFPNVSLMSLSVVALCLFTAGYLLYLKLLPKPIPGIPYNKHAAKHILGDVPEFLAFKETTPGVCAFLAAQLVKLDSPIVQVFMRTFGRPWVVISDFREAQDISIRRASEFDRADFWGDLYSIIAPRSQVHMPTGDAWRTHRKLVADTMSSSFLNDVLAPQIYNSAQVTIDLWREKERLANGHAFNVLPDVVKGSLDSIWAATFGSDIETTKNQLDLLSKIKQLDHPPEGQDGAVDFPVAPEPAAFKALMTLSDSIHIPMNSPMPRLHHWVALNFFPSLVAAGKAKDRLLTERLNAACKKLSIGEKTSEDVQCALDFVVQREATLAKKEGRAPAPDTQDVRDELFTFLIAGHETTSTTLCWALKHLTSNQHVTSKLRSELRAAFSSAVEEDRNPTAGEIAKSNIPYLNATIEEIHRLGCTASAHIRCATRDTEVYGIHIPKGTEVFMLINGPGFIDKPIPVDESKRSKSSQEWKDKIALWDVSDIGNFLPERWLTKGENGIPEFNAKAGPAMPFGAGPRGCFGRKLASLQLRIVIALIVWNFELLPTPPSVSSFTGYEGITYAPLQCYLRLQQVH